MKFNKNFLIEEVVWGGDNRISDEIIEHDRWSVLHKAVFTFEGRYYVTTYSKGATEYQDENPYEYDGQEIECMEVFPVEKAITVYE